MPRAFKDTYGLGKNLFTEKNAKVVSFFYFLNGTWTQACFLHVTISKGVQRGRTDCNTITLLYLLAKHYIYKCYSLTVNYIVSTIEPIALKLFLISVTVAATDKINDCPRTSSHRTFCLYFYYYS